MPALGRDRLPTLVSVTVPILNAEDYVGEQMAALCAQTYRGAWEVVVVDNGCTDRSIDIVRSFASRLPSLRVVESSTRRNLNHARNAGAAAARGDLLCFCDADDVATPRWLEALAAAAAGADVVGGPLDEEILNSARTLAWQSPSRLTELPLAHGFLRYAPGGNCAVWAAVARQLRWDEDFSFGSADVEFCWRAQLGGYTLAFAADAVVQRRFQARAYAMARRYFDYGRPGPLLYRRFRAVGMPRSSLREAFAAWVWLVRGAPRATLSWPFRGRWLRRAGMRSGRLFGSIRHRVLFL